MRPNISTPPNIPSCNPWSRVKAGCGVLWMKSNSTRNSLRRPLLQMTTIQCGGLLFELDGVLADSTPAVARVWTIFANKHGFDPEETVRRAHGRPSIATIRVLLPNANHIAESAVLERMEIEDIEDVVALPGAAE